jgi:PAS domain S-box-containing protein
MQGTPSRSAGETALAGGPPVHRTERRLLLGLVAVASTLLVAAILSLAATWRTVTTARSAAETLDVLSQLHRTVLEVLYAESGTRVYVLTGDEEFLSAFDGAEGRATRCLDRLATLLAEGPRTERLVRLRADVARRFDLLRYRVATRRERGFDPPRDLPSLQEGRRITEEIRAEVQALEWEAGATFEAQRARAESATWNSIGAFSLLTAAVVGTLVAAFVHVRSTLRARAAAVAAVRRLNERLRSQAARMNAVAEERDRVFTLSRDLVAVSGTDGYFRRLNPSWERTLGWKVADLLRRPYVEFVHPDDRDATLRAARGLAEGSEVVDFENRYRAADGSWRRLSWNARLERPGGDTVYAVARDVTERRLMEEDLRRAKESAEEANRELEAFSYSVSHDLRAPLRSIHGFTQAILEDSGGSLPPQVETHFRRVQAASARMGTLIDDLLRLARIGRAEMAFRPVDLGAMAREVFEELRAADPSREGDLVLQEGLKGEGDPVLVRAVLENLLGNAWKFTARTPRAVVEVGRADVNGTPTFFVRDNGAGFDPAYAQRLFGVFQRLHSQSEFPGTGIGLATVARVVHRHGGRVWAEGSPGKGATVWFTLPRREGTA